jgi:hypothetical protein
VLNKQKSGREFLGRLGFLNWAVFNPGLDCLSKNALLDEHVRSLALLFIITIIIG